MSKADRNKNRASSDKLIQKIKRERHGTIPKSLEFFANDDPEFTSKYDELFELLCTKDRTLGVKTSELVILGILASKGQYDALKTHIDRALATGVSRGAIMEAIELAMFYGGGAPSLIYGGLSLIKSLDSKGS